MCPVNPHSATQPPEGRGASLTRERIVQAALGIVDRDGLASLSMRRLAADLGVAPMAAYYYLPKKKALLEAIVEAVMVEANSHGDDVSAPIEERILAAARAYRDALLAHINALPVVLNQPPRTPAAFHYMGWWIDVLRQAGLSHERAVAGLVAMTATVRGIVAFAAHDPSRLKSGDLSALEEQYASAEVRELHDRLLGHPDHLGTGFDLGIRALFRGLVASASEV